VHQTLMMLRGTFTMTKVEPISGAVESWRPGTYSPGTAMLMAPSVSLFGWRGSFAISALSLAFAVLITAQWLKEEGRSPLFALIVLGFAPTLVLGRLAMSDVPSAAAVALGLWLFWRGLDRGAGWWLAAGFVAGASLLLRTPNPLPFVPLFAGAVVRRDRGVGALVIGGLAGVIAYLAAMQWVFGDALYSRTVYHPDLSNLHERLVIYGIGLLILLPGGFVFTAAYRGRRRPEVIAAFVGFVVFYVAQEYSTQWTGPIKRMVLALRYLVPILPLVAFATAESAPRLWRQLLERRTAAERARLEHVMGGALATALVGLALVSVAVHPVFASWASTQAEIRDEIRRLVPVDEVFVTNWAATRKFLPELEQKFIHVERDRTNPEEVLALVEQYGQVYLIFVDRTDSLPWRMDTEVTAGFIGALPSPPHLLLDRQVTSTDRLRIWQLTRDRRQASERRTDG
jgi:4-amino-4-deoxy-L-arabinose transferase-like glycosyltransferase